jgi:hypothetical protein
MQTHIEWLQLFACMGTHGFGTDSGVPAAAAYATHLKRARQMGALTGFASGTTRAGDASAQGSLRMQESIIE